MQLSTPWLFSISLIAFIELCSAKIQLFGDPSLFSIDVNDVGIIRNVTNGLLLPRDSLVDVDPRNILGPCTTLCGPNCCASQQATAGSQKLRRDYVPFDPAISQSSTQEQLKAYIIGRTNPPETDPSIQFVINTIDNTYFPDNLFIFMQLNTGESVGMPIPTSIFQEFGDTAFSLAMASLYGCTAVTWVGTYDPLNPQKQFGVWMSHIWEEPGFAATRVEPEYSDAGQNSDSVESEESGKSGELSEPGVLGEILLDAQPDDWVVNFVQNGFPAASTPDRGTTPANKPPTLHQDGAGEHLDALAGGNVFIMTPDSVFRSGENNAVVDYLGVAQYGVTISRMKFEIIGMDSTARINEEFLYKPYRRGRTTFQRGVASGRVLFEYVPNKGKRRYGRLLMEDGGRNKEGFFEFDFGPATPGIPDVETTAPATS